MPTADRTPLSRKFVHAMAAILAFSVWLTVSPYVIPEAVPTAVHLLFGVLLSALAVLFLYTGLSQPVHQLGSVWHVLLLALVVLGTALVTLPRDNLLFWSDVLTAGGIIVCSAYALYRTSRFADDQSDASRDENLDVD